MKDFIGNGTSGNFIGDSGRVVQKNRSIIIEYVKLICLHCKENRQGQQEGPMFESTGYKAKNACFNQLEGENYWF